MLYFISSTLNTVFFGQAPPKTLSKPSFRSHNGRIRTFKTQIRIGGKNPDPSGSGSETLQQKNSFRNLRPALQLWKLPSVVNTNVFIIVIDVQDLTDKF